MTADNKPPMFGPSFVIDSANHEPRSGKSALMNQMMAEMVGKASVAETIIGNCTTTIPLKFDFDGADAGHTVVIGPTGNGMSAQ
jgi:hypothetical protein